jgi:hypothetical protein
MELITGLMEWLIEKQLSDYGSMASIIGLLISLVTLILVKALRKQFLFRSRIDEHSESLGAIASNVSSLLSSFIGSEEEIDDELAIANVKLRNVQKGASGDLLSDVKRTRKKIAKYRWRHRIGIDWLKPEEKLARQIYTDINIVVEEMSNVKTEIMTGGR